MCVVTAAPGSPCQGNCGRDALPFMAGLIARMDDSCVPGLQTLENLEERARSCPLELAWQGLIFIRFESGGEPVAKQLHAIEERVASYRLADMISLGEASVSEFATTGSSSTMSIEGYHVPSAHPHFRSYTKSYRDDLSAIFPSQREQDDRPASA